MNYRRAYLALIEKAASENGAVPFQYTNKRNRKEGFEIHHKIPVAWGGNNHPSNLVYFTYRQHFTAHHLLARLCGKGSDMWNAYSLMAHSGKYRVTSHQYAIAKENMRVFQSLDKKGKPKSEQTRQRMSEARKLMFSENPELIENLRSSMSKKMAGRIVSKETKLRISESLKKSEKVLKNIEANRLRMLGTKKSPETIAKMKDTAANQPMIACPHCGKICKANQLGRWHGNNCKHKQA